MSWPWSQLGLPGPSNLSQVRRAYAERLKTTHPEEDPEGFQRLHSAYQLASRMARQQERAERTQPSPPPMESEDRQQEKSPDSPPQTEESFNFDRLLQDGADPRRPPQTEEDFDFEELLREEEPPPGPPQGAEQDWDFDRLFAEGEAERAEARRRRGEERRKAQELERQLRREQRQIREEELRSRSRQEQDRWQNTETILHAVEMMYSAGVGGAEWQKFFQGPLFQQNRGSIDLIFGLEDFVSARQDLSQEMKAALFSAYGFEQGPPRPELRPLYQMLLPTWQGEQREKRQQRLYKLGTVIGGIVLVPVGLAILASGWLLAVLLILVAAAFTLVRLSAKGLFSTMRLGQKRRLNAGTIATIVCLAAALSMVLVPGLRERLDGSSKANGQRSQVCRYLEEDYGEKFRSLYNESAPRFDNVFAPEDEHTRFFLAGPDGERDKEAGKLGYTTNYPDMMVLWAMEDFSQAHGLQEVDLVNRNHNLESWETSGTYLIVLPFYGAGETITALGELLEELTREDWYQLRPPSFKVVLCSEQLAAGRLILQEYETSAGEFDAAGVRELYETSFAHFYCAQIIQECQLDRDFTGSETEEIYTLASGGMAELLGKTCCKLYGLDSQEQAAMEYYIPVDSGKVTNLYCVPGGFWEAGGTEDQLQFYRLVHRDAELGVVYLYYPWETDLMHTMKQMEIAP